MPKTLGPCAVCTSPVSDLGARVYLSGNKYAHVHCLTESLQTSAIEAARAQWEIDQREKDQRNRLEAKEAMERMSKPYLEGARTLAQAAVAPVARPVPKPEWEALVDKTIEKCIANFGPLVPRSGLRVYLRRLYQLFVEEGLVVSIVEYREKAPEPEPKKITLEEYLRSGK